MQRLYRYVLAIVPHLWFVFTGLVPVLLNLASREHLWSFEMSPVATISASAGLVIAGLFYAGFRAWLDEYEKVERIWPMIGQGKLRAQCIEDLRGTSGEFQIFANPFTDCQELAVDLEDIFLELGWRQHLPIVTPNSLIQSGVHIAGRRDDRRPMLLERMLRERLAISASVTYTDVAGLILQVHIGRRPRA